MRTLRHNLAPSILALLALACQLAVSFGHVHVGGQSHASHVHHDLAAHTHHHAAHHHDDTQTSISPAQKLYLKLVAKLNAAKGTLHHTHQHDHHHHHDHAPANGPHEDGEPCFACVLKNLSGSVVLPAAAELKFEATIVSRTGFFTESALIASQRTKYTQARAPPPVGLI